MVNQRLAAVAERTLIWCHRRHRHAAISGGYFEGVQLGLHVVPLDVLHREPVPNSTRSPRALDSPRARYCSAFQGYEYSRLLAGSCRMSHLTRYMLHIARYGAYCTVTACHGASYRSISQPKEPLQAMSMMRCSVTSSCTIDFPIIFHMVPALQPFPYLVSRTRAERHMARLPATWKPHDSEFS
jgi:hypothetical protein